MYRHVDALNAAGMPAAVLHSTRRFQCTWFEHNTRVTDTTATRPGLRDLLVLPEIYAGLLPETSRATPSCHLQPGGASNPLARRSVHHGGSLPTRRESLGGDDR